MSVQHFSNLCNIFFDLYDYLNHAIFVGFRSVYEMNMNLFESTIRYITQF